MPEQPNPNTQAVLHYEPYCRGCGRLVDHVPGPPKEPGMPLGPQGWKCPFHGFVPERAL